MSSISFSSSSSHSKALEERDELDERFQLETDEVLLPQNDDPSQRSPRLRRQSDGSSSSDDHLAADTDFLSELNCGPTRCTFLACTVGPLAKRQFTLLKVRSRLWVRTLDRVERNDIEISSKLTARVTRLPYGVNPAYLGHRSHLVTTQVRCIPCSFLSLCNKYVFKKGYLKVIPRQGLFSNTSTFLKERAIVYMF